MVHPEMRRARRPLWQETPARRGQAPAQQPAQQPAEASLPSRLSCLATWCGTATPTSPRRTTRPSSWLSSRATCHSTSTASPSRRRSARESWGNPEKSGKPHVGRWPAARKLPQFAGTTDPILGELYLGYWSESKTRYAVMVLPLPGRLRRHGNAGHPRRHRHGKQCAKSAVTVDRALFRRGSRAGQKTTRTAGPWWTNASSPVVYFDRKQ